MRISLSLAAAAFLTLSAHATACDPKTEVVVDLRDEPARRIFEDLAKSEGLTISNAGVLDGHTLTEQFKACSMREAMERLSNSNGFSIRLEGTNLTFLRVDLAQK